MHLPLCTRILPNQSYGRSITWGKAIRNSCTVCSSPSPFATFHQSLVDSQGWARMLSAGCHCFSVLFLTPPGMGTSPLSSASQARIWCHPGLLHLSSHCVLL